MQQNRHLLLVPYLLLTPHTKNFFRTTKLQLSSTESVNRGSRSYVGSDPCPRGGF